MKTVRYGDTTQMIYLEEGDIVRVIGDPECDDVLLRLVRGGTCRKCWMLERKCEKYPLFCDNKHFERVIVEDLI